MSTLNSISQFTPTAFLFYLFFSIFFLPIFSIDITKLLSSNPNLSEFSSLLTSTSIASDLSLCSSVTLLVVPNSFLHTSDLATQYPSPSTNLADILRYHVILQYLSWSDLRLVPPTGKLVTTLLQNTGRASSNSGTVNITRDPVSNSITFLSPTTNATVISLVKSIPFNLSIFSINSLLIPSDIDILASETRPPLGLNITKALIDGHNFNVAASMLLASGVEQEFEADEGGAGLTLFVPTDDAFSQLPTEIKFQSLPAEEKADVLRFHVLHSYYPLGSLESIVNPVQPTLATEQNGAGSFTLSISRVNRSVVINSGIVQATVTQTVFDQNPVAIFGISEVLLPKEFFGSNPIMLNSPGNEAAQPPDIATSPETSPDLYGPTSHLSSQPGLDLRSGAAAKMVLRNFFGLWCTVICLFIIF